MGNNQLGQLGINSSTVKNCNVPTMVEGLSGITKVSCGASHTLAVSFER
jgi:alpha-tubulin suppressor-like RCC1 family protein